MVTPKGSTSTEGETLQVSVPLYRCSICPPLVTRQISILQSSSCQTQCNIWRSTVATASMILYRSCDEGLWRQLLLSNARCCNVCGRNVITGLTSAVSPRVDISSTCKVGQKLESLSLCWRTPLRHDHPVYCTAEVGIPGVNYPVL
jgi:hypothetical protein